MEIYIAEEVAREEWICTEEELATARLTRACGDRWFDERQTAVLLIQPRAQTVFSHRSQPAAARLVGFAAWIYSRFRKHMKKLL